MTAEKCAAVFVQYEKKFQTILQDLVKCWDGSAVNYWRALGASRASALLVEALWGVPHNMLNESLLVSKKGRQKRYHASLLAEGLTRQLLLLLTPSVNRRIIWQLCKNLWEGVLQGHCGWVAVFTISTGRGIALSGGGQQMPLNGPYHIPSFPYGSKWSRFQGHSHTYMEEGGHCRSGDEAGLSSHHVMLLRDMLFVVARPGQSCSTNISGALGSAQLTGPSSALEECFRC